MKAFYGYETCLAHAYALHEMIQIKKIVKTYLRAISYKEKSFSFPQIFY